MYELVTSDRLVNPSGITAIVFSISHTKESSCRSFTDETCKKGK